MSRFTVATDLSSWRDGQQSNRRARREGGKRRKGKKARTDGGRQVPARAGGTELVEAVPKREAGRGPGRGPRGQERRRGRDTMRGEEDEGFHEAELDDQELELEPTISARRRTSARARPRSPTAAEASPGQRRG
ncbi:MAG: hypothetical protein IPG17_29230 [Sandaracinaceae bacterium]|nr:hypothetical protein [Sandaracinaceae bacterium]